MTNWAAIAAAGMDTWTAQNSVAGATSLWWAKARDVTIAADNWHTHWTSNSAANTPGGFVQALASVDNKPCDVSTTADWTTAATLADLAACKTSCETATYNNIVVQLNSGAAGHNGGGRSMARWDAAATYCGGYSWTVSGTSCQWMKDKDTPAAIAGAGATGDKCYKMTGAKTASDLQVTLKDKWALLINGVTGAGTSAETYTLLTNMQNEMNTQAGLEKAWLQAWYLQQYWNNVKDQLNPATGGTTAKIYADAQTALAASGAPNNSNTASVHGATYIAGLVSTGLTTAQETLATYQTATAAAQSVVAALGTRIIRTEDELTELAKLVETSTAAGVVPNKILDQAAKLRKDDLDAFMAPTTGEKAKATAALNAALAQVATTTAFNPTGPASADTAW